MNPVWLGALARTGVIGMLALAAWLAGGVRAALAAIVIALAAAWLIELRHLARLRRWLGGPQGAATPDASGVWGETFSALARRARSAQRTRNELAAALARFTDAAHAMPDGVIVLAGGDAIEWMNRTAESHFGLDRRRDRGVPVTNLVRQPDFVGYLRNADFGAPLALESTRIPGQRLSLQVVPFGSERRLLVSRDITQIVALENMRRDFVANVSHELKTPLTVVGGFLETLAENLPALEPGQAERFVGLALEQARHMQRLIEDLLTLSRIESAAPPALDEEVEVAELLAEVGREAAALSSGRHGIEIEAGEAVRLLGSRSELRSALANLASNAVRYTPEGGRVALRWRLLEDGSGLLSIEDNGIGIEARHLPRLTERFYRVDQGRSRDTGGTGLGLAIVKHVLARHQARLEIESTPGAGSRFSARFPPSRVRTPAPGAQARS